MAKALTGTTHGTLGDSLARMSATPCAHPALINSLKALWAFASDSPGVRHGSQHSPSITLPEAQYVITMCDAAIRLLLADQGAA